MCLRINGYSRQPFKCETVHLYFEGRWNYYRIILRCYSFFNFALAIATTHPWPWPYLYLRLFLVKRTIDLRFLSILWITGFAQLSNERSNHRKGALGSRKFAIRSQCLIGPWGILKQMTWTHDICMATELWAHTRHIRTVDFLLWDSLVCVCVCVCVYGKSHGRY